MNRVFKTKWSAAHQQYVVIDEHHSTKRKASKSAVALAVAALMMAAGGASAAYVEKGYVAKENTTAAVQAAAKSWESNEYKKQWGLEAIKASSAYALGFNGQGVKVGIMDSGAFFKHPELSGDRFSATHVTGVYGSTGYRYPQQATDKGEFKKGEAYDVNGSWMSEINDSHGTSVIGVAGANRDGNEFHGVAWGSDFVSGNSGGTDNTNYGPFLDHDFYYAAWKAVVDDLVSANGSKRGGVINNSFGTNGRIVAQPGVKGADGDDNSEQLPARTTADTEYEYFYSNKVYNGESSFVDAAYEAVKGTNVVQIMTTGNRDMENPYYRPNYPYFHPEAEKHWIAVAGVRLENRDDLNDRSKPIGKVDLRNDFNEAGNAKWWTISAPGDRIYSSRVDVDKTSPTYGQATYKSANGTSSAAPHVAGAMGVLMSRYDQMSAIQVRDVLFTTASHKNADGSNFTSWTAGEGQVDVRLGWGIPDLEKGMYGLGQLLGKFEYDMAGGSLDVWSNDISEIALKQREAEDKAWMTATSDGTNVDAGGAYTLGDGFVLRDGDDDDKNHIIALEDAKKWRGEYYKVRAEAIKFKIDNGLYSGSLVKRGEGTLVLTGYNTFTGGVTVELGTLLGFTESFGTKAVEVNGGKLGLLATYNDTFTKKGTLTSTAAHKADINVNKGGTLVLVAGQNVQAGAVTFKEGAKVGMISDDLRSVYDGTDVTGTLTASSLTGVSLAKNDDSLAFFKTTMTAPASGSTLTVTMARDEAVTLANIATTDNGRAIGEALEAAAEGEVLNAVLGSSRAQVAATYDSLGSDAILNVSNASVVNTLTMTRAIQDQAQGIGKGRTVDFADGNGRIWATGVGSWGDVDFGQSSVDNDFYAGFFGGEITVHPSTKLGAFFGAGTTKFKGGEFGKIDSDDLHFGVYGVSSIAEVASVNYGLSYTKQDRDQQRVLAFGTQTGANSTSADADILQIFAEAAYTGFNTAQYSVEPYFGFNWINVKSDDFVESVGNTVFATNSKDQDIEVTTLGVRGAVPFTLGTAKLAFKANASWSHYFGDTEAKASMTLGDSGIAALKGGELKDQANIGLGIEGKLSDAATFGFSYTGSYNSDVKSNGVSVNVRYAF